MMPRKPDALKRLKTSVTLTPQVIGFLGRQATIRGKSMSISRLIECLVAVAEANPSLLPAMPETRNQNQETGIHP